MKSILLFTKTSLLLGAMLYMTSCREMMPENEVVAISENATSRTDPETAYPGETGTLKKGTLFGSEITYSEIDGKAVFQGDIILSPEQLAGKNARTEAAGLSNKPELWSNATINYTIDPTITNKDAIMSAIAEFEATTPIKFVLLQNLGNTYPGIRVNYVTFKRGRGYSSSIGRVGGQQFITLPIFATKGAILHEIGHTVGLFHEHTRHDRLNSIKINLNNVAEADLINMYTYQAQGYDGFQYMYMDMKSIMMLDSYAYSKNGQPVMTLLPGTTFTVQREKLSNEDTYGITVMYGNIYALSGNLYAGDALKGKRATCSMYWENAEAMCATQYTLYIAHNNTIWAVNKLTGARTETITGISGIKSMIYAQKKVYFLQNGYLYNYNPVGGVGIKSPGQYWLPATALSYCYGFLFIVNGDTLFRVSMDGQNFVSMGSGYKGVTEMVPFNDKLYILKKGKLWKMDSNSGAIMEHGNGTYAADAQLTANTKNLLIIDGGNLYSVGEWGEKKTISNNWPTMKHFTAVGAED
ncbi:M12 family metallopeptidase [Dyadobacter sp. CY347]|uniref:M12 family metallopeptidase n=1 Tax=Dyadobacter sp. CY347 TaxID=2909336 RepID=UPI001F1DF6A9|nr:M12 family metallopeptidase [Dyadobacter sp. CY347]MCF2489204.1 M12 family metallopeptidase [Dyadobacter sp. CY347]